MALIGFEIIMVAAHCIKHPADTSDKTLNKCWFNVGPASAGQPKNYGRYLILLLQGSVTKL